VRSRLDVAAGRLTRFVGRDMELGTLVDRWERAQDGEGQTVVVLGEAGVGKSRLVYQLHEHVTAVPHTWLECGATPYTEGTPFHPIIALVAQGLGFAPEDPRPSSSASWKSDSARSPQRRPWACSPTFSVCRHPRACS
jgi:predicted ATPase